MPGEVGGTPGHLHPPIPPLDEGLHVPKHTETWEWGFNINGLAKWARAGAGQGWAMQGRREAVPGRPRIFRCSDGSPRHTGRAPGADLGKLSAPRASSVPAREGNRAFC